MTDQNASTPDPGGQQNIAELERAVDDARQKLAAMLEQQRGARTQVFFAVIIILVVMIVWGVKTFSMVQTNLSADKLEAAAKQYGPAYMDQGRVILERSFTKALPTYQELGTAKLKELTPQLRESAEQEFTQLADELDGELSETLKASLTRIETRVDDALRAKFPYVAEGEALKSLVDQFDAQHASIETDLHNMVEQEMVHLRGAARSAIERSFQQAAPTYRNLAIEKAKAMAPELRASAERDVAALAEGIQSDIDMTVSNAMSRIESAMNASIREKFPHVTEGKSLDTLVEQLEDQHVVIHADLTSIFHAEVKRAKGVLVKFNVPDVVDHEMAELEKDFLQAGLQYALYELHVSGTDEGLNWDVLRAPSLMSLDPVGDISVLTD